jgi:hypothetical protein
MKELFSIEEARDNRERAVSRYEEHNEGYREYKRNLDNERNYRAQDSNHPITHHIVEDSKYPRPSNFRV